MNHRDPQATCPEEILAIYLIINGPLGMSAGKIAAQGFQACQRLYQSYLNGEGDGEQRRRFEQWLRDGTRTITRIAETPAIFERACRELPGALMVDEGLTEIEPDSATILATWPLYRKGDSKLLQHKRLALLEGPPIISRRGGLRDLRELNKALVMA